MSAEVIKNNSTVLNEELEDTIDVDFEVNVHDSVRMYLNNIGQTPLLKAAEEVELAKDIEAGLYAEKLLENDNEEFAYDRKDLETIAKLGRIAYDRMVSANLRLVVSMARKHQASGVPLLDLVQEGNIALMHAVKKFDYKRGFKFSTAATIWIRKAIITAKYRQSSRMSLGVLDAERANIINKRSARLLEELGREPSCDEIADSTGMSVDIVRELQLMTKDYISLDMELGDNSAPFHTYLKDETIGEISDMAVGQALRDALDTLLWHLDEEDELILRSITGYGGVKMSNVEIAKEVGTTVSGVESRKKKIIRHLQKDRRVGHLRHFLR